MPWSGTGVPVRETPVSTGPVAWADAVATGDTLITTTDHDFHDQDIANMLANTVTLDGQTVPVANLPMGGFKHTNVAVGTASNQYATVGQLQGNSLIWGGTAGGTPNAIVIALSPAIISYTTGQQIAFKVASSNTTAVTINAGGGVVNLTYNGASPLTSGVLLPGAVVLAEYDGTQFQIVSSFAPTVGTSGGSTSVGTSVSLAGSSTRGQNVAMSAVGQSITLPDATTMATGGPLFSIVNSGTYQFAIRRNDASILTVLTPGGSADIYLDDNSNAAGIWHYVGQRTAGGIAAYPWAPSGIDYTSISVPIAVGTSALFLGAVSSSVYAVAIDTTTNPATVGTPVLISATHTGSATVDMLVAIDSTHALAVYGDNGGTGAKAMVLTVSGSTVTVNTASTAPALFNPDPIGVALSSTLYVFAGYNGSSQPLAVAISVSGTTATFGTAVIITTTAVGHLSSLFKVSATSAVAFWSEISSGVRAFSISGTTITLGTTSFLSNNSGRITVAAFTATSYIVCCLGGGVTGALIALQNVTISGTTCTIGTQFNPSLTSDQSPVLSVIDATHAVLCIRSGGGGAVTSGILNILNTSGTLTQIAQEYIAYNSSQGDPSYTVLSGNIVLQTATFVAGQNYPGSSLWNVSGGNVTYVESPQSVSSIPGPVFTDGSTALAIQNLGGDFALANLKISTGGITARGLIQLPFLYSAAINIVTVGRFAIATTKGAVTVTNSATGGFGNAIAIELAT